MTAYSKASKKTFWAAMIFYILITFEFFYMASPFALYFYALYQPGVSLMEYLPGGTWLMGFFLPHVVLETASPLINLHNLFGLVLSSLGLLAFIAGAVQIYYAKLRRKGEVKGFLYRHIRHPQYLALAIAGLGFLLLWPRYLVLIMYVTMLFVYYLLAKYEEADCLARYGEAYRAYMQKTNMFLPFWRRSQKLPAGQPVSKLKAGLRLALLYMVALAVGLNLAHGLQHYTVGKLYTYTSGNSVYVSVTEMEPEQMQKIVKTVLADNRVQEKISAIRQDEGIRLINYLTPQEWYASEIPMNQDGAEEGSHFSMDFDLSRLKLIFTKAEFKEPTAPEGLDVLTEAPPLIPQFEVRLSWPDGLIEQIWDLPQKAAYGGMPMPLF